jgi:DUF1365 family protein
MRYLFRVMIPGRGLRVRILETDADGPLLAATYSAALQPLTTAGIVRSFLRMPWVTLKIIGAIHFEAARLWLKGVPFFPKPAPPAPASFADGAIRGPLAAPAAAGDARDGWRGSPSSPYRA